jgi:glucose-6-phosphate dehydrogenase assembly protein OpcA
MTDLLPPPPLTRSEHWQSKAISPNAIGRKLAEMWAEVASERRSGNRLARAVAESASMRTQTVNLIVVTDDGADHDEIAHLVTHLPDITPSRVVLLAANRTNKDALEIGLDIEERPNKPPHAPTRIEVISVRGRGERLASVANPLLVPELPDFVWCTTPDFANDVVLSELADQADRIVVDSSHTPDPSNALNYLVKLIDEGGSELRVSDMAWTRLSSWRQMIAQFFDVPSHLASLSSAEQVVIECARRDDRDRSGITCGLLAAGWLASCMGWRAPGEELVKSREGWKLTLRAGQKGASHEVILYIREMDKVAPSPSVVSVTITGGPKAPGTFTVRRTSPETLTTISDTPSGGNVERTIYSASRDEARLLGIELRQFDSDPVFEQSLRFAANLWPSGDA